MKIESSLSEVISNLNALPVALEQNFLEVADKLQTISFSCREISHNSEQIVALMSDESLDSLKIELKELLNSFGGTATGAFAGGADFHAPMAEMEQLLREAQRQIAELQKRVSSLRNLALLTRITSHASGVREEEFESVAQNIKSLGALINEKTTAIHSALSRLCAKVRQATSQDLTSHAKKQQLGTCEVREIHSSIDALGRVHQQCSSFSTLIAGQSAEMTDNIAKVVSSIQYHDITRQKMEHVSSALAELLSGCRKPSGEFSYSDRERELGDMCALQVAQLHLVHREITQSIQTMDASLKTIAETAARTAANADRLSGAACEINDSGLAGVDQNLAVALSCNTENAQEEEGLFLLLKSVMKTTGEISHFLSDIEDIGEEIKLIALNAIIKALCLEKGGDGMHVIAMAIKAESDGICSQTSAIARHFHQTTAMADKVKILIERIHGGNVVKQQSLSSQLGESLREIQVRNQAITATVQTVHVSSRQLQQLIADALRSVSTSGLPTVLASSIIPTLESVIMELRWNQPLTVGNRENLLMLDKQRNAYTMEPEREVHDTFLAGGGVTRGKVIPLHRKEKLPAAHEFNDDNLGHNVEMF